MADPLLIYSGTENRSDSLTLPSSISAGDLLLVSFSRDQDVTPSLTGWTAISYVHTEGDGQTLGVMAKLAIGIEGGTSVNFNIGDATYLVHQYRNVDPTTPWSSASTISANGASGDISPSFKTITIPSVTTPTNNSILFALFGGDVVDDSATYTYSTPAGFGHKTINQEDYDTLCAFDKVQATAGASGTVSSDINTDGYVGIMFSINAMVSVTNVRALIINSGKITEITDAQLGIGLKPLVLYNDKYVERSSTEGEPLIIDGNNIRVKTSGETLLI